MQPFAPSSEANALLHIISVGGLHLVCVLSGVLGVLLMLAVSLVRRGAGVDTQA